MTVVPGSVNSRRASWLPMVPDGTNSAASFPTRSAKASWRALIVGSSPYTSSPTSASAMALRISGVGRVTVSERRSTKPELTGSRLSALPLGSGGGVALGQHVARPVRSLPVRHRRGLCDPGHEPGAGDELVLVDVARAVGVHVPRPDAHDELRLGPLLLQRIVEVDRGRAVEAHARRALEVDEQHSDL